MSAGNDFTNNFDQQSNATTGVAAPAHRSIFARNWPRVFLLFSVAVVVLTFVSIIFNFLRFLATPNIAMLNVYCLIFSLMGLCAELRQFTICRRISYRWLKYMYFLTYYKPRGVFYAFFGLLLLGSDVLMYVAGALAIIVGVIMVVVSFVCDLPVYEDPQEQLRTANEFRRYNERKYGYPGASSFAEADATASAAAQQQEMDLQQQLQEAQRRADSANAKPQPLPDTPAVPASREALPGAATPTAAAKRLAPPVAVREGPASTAQAPAVGLPAKVTLNKLEGAPLGAGPTREPEAMATASPPQSSNSASLTTSPWGEGAERPQATVAHRTGAESALRAQFMSSMEKDSSQSGELKT